MALDLQQELMKLLEEEGFAIPFNGLTKDEIIAVKHRLIFALQVSYLLGDQKEVRAMEKFLVNLGMPEEQFDTVNDLAANARAQLIEMIRSLK